jgi:hypothetical protein
MEISQNPFSLFLVIFIHVSYYEFGSEPFIANSTDSFPFWALHEMICEFSIGYLEMTPPVGAIKFDVGDDFPGKFAIPVL